MHAWCLALAKQTSQTLPSLRTAATQHLVRRLADGKQLPQACLSSSHAASIVYSQVKPEHGKLAAKLGRHCKQATASALGFKQMCIHTSVPVKQLPRLGQTAIVVNHAHSFNSLHRPASGQAQSIMTLQKPMLLQLPGKVHRIITMLHT